MDRRINRWRACGAILVLAAISTAAPAWPGEIGRNSKSDSQTARPPQADQAIQASSEMQEDADEAPMATGTEYAVAPPTADNSSYFGNESSLFGSSPSAGNGYRFLASAEMLVWWLTPGHTPPLATFGTTAPNGVRQIEICGTVKFGQEVRR